jgi:hypothetical protein
MPAKPSIDLTVHLEFLLSDDALCKRIAVTHPDIDKIFTEVQRAACNESNRDNVGPTILALKQISDVLLLFKAKGDVLNSSKK